MAIMDLNLDNNSYGNNILLSKCKNLQILRLRCSKDLGHSTEEGHKKAMTFKWIHCQPQLSYLSIQCDISNNIDSFICHLPLLSSLKILRLEHITGFNEEDFFEIISSLPSLEVK